MLIYIDEVLQQKPLLLWQEYLTWGFDLDSFRREKNTIVLICFAPPEKS